MTDYGVTDAGFVRKPREVILAEVAQRQREEIDPNWNAEPDSLAGQINSIYADQLAELWAAAEAVYSSGDRSLANGAALDAIGALTGTPRRPATKATATLTLAVAAGAVVPAGSIVSAAGEPATRFVTLESTPPTDIGDSFAVPAASETAGELSVAAEALTVIATPVAGWTAVTNAAPALPGLAVETDEQYRIRQFTELAIVGGATCAGIVADVRRVEAAGVVDAAILENVTDSTDANGLPPHSFEVIVLCAPGADVEDAIAQSITGNKAVGIGTHGSITRTVTTASGESVDIKFSRATERRVFAAARLVTGAGYDAEAARAAVAQPLPMLGSDVFSGPLVAKLMAVPGVVNVVALGTSFSAISDPGDGVSRLAIGIREIATIDADDIELIELGGA